MFATPSGTDHIVRLDVGEEVIETLTAYLKQQGIGGGVISGIGAVMRTTLGYFDLPSREYQKREFAAEMELINLTGNITWVDDAPLIHAHVTLSGADYLAYSGHLFGATVAITGEFYIRPSEVKLQRALDKRTGLKLISGL